MRARLPAFGGRQQQSARGRIWRHRLRAADPDAGGVLDPHEHARLRLGLSQRAGAASRRPKPCHAARKSHRRLLLHQRHGFRARPCGRLRSVGGGGRQGLGLQGRAPLFQAHGARAPERRRRPFRQWGGRLARHGRPAACNARDDDESALPRLHRCRERGRLFLHRRLQRREAGRLRADGNDGVERPPLVRRERLSPAGAEAPERVASRRHARRADRLQRAARGRRRRQPLGAC